MRTIKIKLPFNETTALNERRSKLHAWANALLKGSQIVVLEEIHYGKMSYIVVENTRVVGNR